MEKTLGQKIHDHRKTLNLNQEELGEKLHISRQNISKWERDLGTPDLYMLAELAELFGCTLDELTKNEETPLVEENALTSDEIVLINEENTAITPQIVLSPIEVEDSEQDTEISPSQFEKKYLWNLLGFLLNSLIFLWHRKFFHFSHASEQYAIIFMVIAGLFAIYALLLLLMKKKYKNRAFWSALILNVACLVVQIVQIILNI